MGSLEPELYRQKKTGLIVSKEKTSGEILEVFMNIKSWNHNDFHILKKLIDSYVTFLDSEFNKGTVMNEWLVKIWAESQIQEERRDRA